MGWKTVTGTLLMAVGEVFDTWVDPFPAIGPILKAVGIALAGIGVRHAIAKAGGTS